jgi:23S rRNA pseudouridine1911/1915/1917 synthase
MSFNGGFTILADDSDVGRRLDVVLASRLPECSRSLAASLITRRHILIDGQPKKPGYRLKSGDEIRGRIPPPAQVLYQPEPIPLQILFEDPNIVVINKQPGLVVHPAPGHHCGTLVNALLYHCPDLQSIGGEIRPGIVHRLDKDTSGTMVVAKTAAALEKIARQFKQRKTQKTYLAIVHGEMDAAEGVIKLPIGRHLKDRKRMSTTSRKTRAAETHWRVQKRFKGFALLELDLKTGRTHQIRVHCAAIDHPVVGDPVYRPRRRWGKFVKTFLAGSNSMADVITPVNRQMLHAWRLGFSHPATGEFMTFESPLPRDMATLLEELKRAGQGG